MCLDKQARSAYSGPERRALAAQWLSASIRKYDDVFRWEPMKHLLTQH